MLLLLVLFLCLSVGLNVCLAGAAYLLLREQEVRLLRETDARLFLTNIPAVRPGIIAIDEMSVFKVWDELAANLLGWTTKEALGQRITLIMPQEFWERHMQGIARYVVEEQGSFVNHLVTVPMLHKNGTILTVNMLVTALRQDDGRFLFTAHVWKQ